MYNHFGFGVVRTPVENMYYTLTTFYKTFANFGNSPCLFSNPVPSIFAGVWMLTIALILQCLIFRVSNTV